MNSLTLPDTNINRQKIHAALYFASALLLAELRNIQSLVINLGLPVFMLLSFWLPSIGAHGEEAEVILLMFPAIATLSVMMPGHIQATRLTRWREQGIFERLILTPIPLHHLILGAALVPVSLGIVLGMLMLIFAMPIIGIALSIGTALEALGVMALISITFSAFGLLLAAFIKRSDVAGYAYFFAIVPLFFLGSFSSDMLPPMLNSFTPWLPTTMAVRLVNALLMEGGLGVGAWIYLLGLGSYAIVFSAFGLRSFRWE